LRTNYYPLWEAERGHFRFTYEVKKPRPLKELVGMIGKFSHLTDTELGILEKEALERYGLIKAMSESMPLEERE
jgi:hypothetical protein